MRSKRSGKRSDWPSTLIQETRSVPRRDRATRSMPSAGSTPVTQSLLCYTARQHSCAAPKVKHTPASFLSQLKVKLVARVPGVEIVVERREELFLEYIVG